MKNTFKMVAIMGLTALTACNTPKNQDAQSGKTVSFSSEPETLDVRDIINNRFKEAAKAFNGHESGEIKIINGGGNGDLSDSPTGDDSFKKPVSGTSEMICYNSDTGKIVAADSPNKLGADFKKDISDKINEALKTDKDGKVVIYRTALRQDFNDSQKKVAKKIMTVAWGKAALTGNKNSKLVCTISAIAPEA